MIDGLHAFLGTASEEIDRTLVEPWPVGFGINNVGTHLTDRFQRTLVEAGIDLHATGINHRAQQATLRNQFTQQHRHTEQFQRRNADKLQVTGIADAFGHRHADTQPGVRAGAATDSDSIKRDGMVISKRQRLVHKRTQPFGMVRARVVLLLKDDV